MEAVMALVSDSDGPLPPLPPEAEPVPPVPPITVADMTTEPPFAVPRHGAKGCIAPVAAVHSGAGRGRGTLSTSAAGATCSASGFRLDADAAAR